MKKVAIVQSNYIPWKGYFDLIAATDEFIIYDDMQYTRRDWRNRNRIKTPHGLQWLTVPVQVKGKYEQTISETLLADRDWGSKHWKILQLNYARASCFSELADWFQPLYLESDFTGLSELNQRFIQAVCDYLQIETKFSLSSDFALAPGKTDRLVSLCQQVDATEYLSGPAARDYIDENLFNRAGIKLSWFDYSGYPEYPQLWGGFEHGVTILDLLFNCGEKSREYMKFVRPKRLRGASK